MMPFSPLLAVVLCAAPQERAVALETPEDTPVQGALEALADGGVAGAVRVSGAPAHGTVKLDPLEGSRFTYTPGKDFHGADAFSVRSSAGRVAMSTRVTVQVASVNDAPQVTPLVLRTVEDVAARGVLQASDVDGDRLSYAIATAPAHGDATVDPTGAVTYRPALDAHGDDRFTVSVNDGAASATADVTVTVSSVNDAPTLATLRLTLPEDGVATGQLSASDVDGDALTYRVVRPPKHGAVELDARSGALRYVPAANFHGNDVVGVAVSDGALQAQTTVELEVTAVNDAPALSSLTLSTSEDAPTQGALAGTDLDGDTLTYSLVRPPSRGQATVNASSGAVTYVPSRDANGEDTFTVSVTDGVASTEALVKVAIAAVNDAPAVSAASFSPKEDEPFEEAVVASDVDGDALTYSVARGPKHGEVVLDARTGHFTYRPVRDFHGPDGFGVEVSDGRLKSAAAVTLQVSAVNDAPVARPLGLTTREDVAVRGTAVASDVDGDVLTFVMGRSPEHGQATVDPATGALTYSPAADFHGNDAFTLTVRDGLASAVVEVSVAVSAVNDAPIAAAATLRVDEDQALAAALQGTDVDGDRLTFALGQKPKHGTATVEANTGAFTYVPAHDFHGPDELTFQVSDGALTSTAVVTLDVTSVNDAPVARPLALRTAEDTAVRGTVTATDVDAQALRFTVSQPAAHGQASVAPESGAVTYLPAADINGTDTFTVTASDGELEASSVVSVTITPVYDPPLVRAETFECPEDTATEGQLPASHPDGAPLTFRLTSSPRLGVAELLDASTGRWRFTPGPDLNGSDVVAFEVRDRSTTVKGTLSIHVKPVNDAPVLTALRLETVEGGSVEGVVQGRDVDGDPLTLRLATPPRSGRATVVDAAQGRVRYEPAPHENGEFTFTVTASDAQASSAPVQVTVVVEARNDAPVASDQTLTIDEDEQVTGTLKALDVDGDALTFRLGSAPQHGTAQVLGATTGGFSYVPADNFSGIDSFTFVATDPSGATSTGTVRLTVKPVNDPPVAFGQDLDAPTRGRVSGQLKGFDRDSSALRFEVLEQPSVGHVRDFDPRTGAFVYETDGSEGDQTWFEYVVSDGSLTSVPARVRLHVRQR
ncbi:MAG: tandem-95 repeat protein [Myxococcaceae bacterium]|nr:tandem-95 repeat protein [Myxococcaceae bacterium]